MLFPPISSLNSKNYPRDIDYMLPVILRVCLDLSENCHCRTASWDCSSPRNQNLSPQTRFQSMKNTGKTTYFSKTEKHG